MRDSNIYLISNMKISQIKPWKLAHPYELVLFSRRNDERLSSFPFFGSRSTSSPNEVWKRERVSHIYWLASWSGQIAMPCHASQPTFFFFFLFPSSCSSSSFFLLFSHLNEWRPINKKIGVPEPWIAWESLDHRRTHTIKDSPPWHLDRDIFFSL